MMTHRLPQLFALAIFSSATLLFMAQPLTAKTLLPVLGGSPAVWSTCLVFFQAVLLSGYLYAHGLSTYVSERWQLPVHVSLLIAASLTLVGGVAIGEPQSTEPRWWLLRALTTSVGLPLFVLSATAPLLQKWYSRTSALHANDPYFLYAASNAGSLLGLLGYVFVEPLASHTAQVSGWSGGVWIVGILVTTCGIAALRTRRPTPDTSAAPLASPRFASTPFASRLPTSRLSQWVALALVPSALLVSVTQHLASDVVSAPLLWIVPLALYLMTFIAAFSRRSIGRAHQWGRVAPVVALIVLVLSLAEVRYPILPIALAHLAALIVLAMMCHTRLAESRPDPAHLTTYFLCISLGGVLGGVAVALIAPLVFSSILEYPLAIGAALLLRPQSVEADRAVGSPEGRWRWRMAAALLYAAGCWIAAPGTLVEWLPAVAERSEIARRTIGASLAIPAIALLVTARTALLFAGAASGLLMGASMVRTDGQLLLRARTFFGVHEVTSVQNGTWHVLTHGTTTHGIQAMTGNLRPLPTAYYHPAGPIGDVIFTLAAERRLRDVAVVGLGVGALAAYAGKGVRMDFFEIDAAVVRIAEDPKYFTYLSQAKGRAGATVRTFTMDGRLGLSATPPTSYDLIVVDAFSSDAIPTHLITREAVAMYRSRLEARGVIAFHVSSRYFDLTPVLANIAADLGLVCYARRDAPVPPEKLGEGMRASLWVVLANSENDLGQVSRSGPRWARQSSTGARLWTDDYSNVLGVLQD